MFKKVFIFGGILSLLFLSDTVLKSFGIVHGITVSYLLISIAFVIKLMESGDFIFINKNKNELIFMLTVVLITLVQFIVRDFTAATSVLNIWFLPVLLLLFLNQLNNYYKINIFRIILVFFIVECTFAIFERFTNIVFFPAIDMDLLDPYGQMEKFEFRSNSLWGHPLMNANIVSIILSFILISNIKLKFKLFFYLIGIYALFAFNARGATLMWAFLTMFFLKMYYNKTKNSYKLYFIISFITLFLILLYSLIVSDWGGRLFHNDKVLDESALVRLASLDIFNNISTTQIFFGGVNSKYFTENGYINICLNYGIILGLTLIIFQLKIIFKNLKKYSLENKLFILFAFLGVGFLNNNLQQSTPFLFFILCVNSFPVLKAKKNVFKQLNNGNNPTL